MNVSRPPRRKRFFFFFFFSVYYELSKARALELNWWPGQQQLVAGFRGAGWGGGGNSRKGP